MRRALVALIALVVVSTAAAKDRAPPEQLDQWVTFYYLDPRPDEVSAALQAITKQGLFENDNVQAPLSGFFTEVFRANPDRVAG